MAASNDSLKLSPFRTLRNDAEGAAYAQSHSEEYPFSNDYFDAPAGAPHAIAFTPSTVCTGIIRVGYRTPLKDHVVSCDDLVEVAAVRPLTVAVWYADGNVIQVSELYRP